MAHIEAPLRSKIWESSYHGNVDLGVWILKYDLKIWIFVFSQVSEHNSFPVGNLAVGNLTVGNLAVGNYS